MSYGDAIPTRAEEIRDILDALPRGVSLAHTALLGWHWSRYDEQSRVWKACGGCSDDVLETLRDMQERCRELELMA